MSATVTSLSQARRSQTTLAYEKLEELIVTLQLKPGSSHSENSLQQLIGIGRTPVRESLQRLSREGLVEILPRKGIKITRVDYEGQFLRVGAEPYFACFDGQNRCCQSHLGTKTGFWRYCSCLRQGCPDSRPGLDHAVGQDNVQSFLRCLPQ